MKEYSKVIYGKKYTLRKEIIYDLLVDDVWVSSSNSLDHLRGCLFERLLNRLYVISLGRLVVSSRVLECYHNTELFISCFKQEWGNNESPLQQ